MSITILVSEPEMPLAVYEDQIDILDSLSPVATVWIDIEGEDPDQFNSVAERFDLHELSVEDCITPGHFPKLDDYGAYLFMIFRALKPWAEMEDTWTRMKEDLPLDEDDEGVHERFTRKVAVYLSRNFFITYRRKEVAWLDAIVRQTTQHPEHLIQQGTEVIAHKVIDVLVDRFLRNMAFFDKIIDHFEELTLKAPDDFDVSDLLELKHNLTSIRTLLRNQRGVVSRLASDPSLIEGKPQRRYFKDIDDHCVDLVSMAENQVENTLSLRDTYLAMANVRLGDTMRILAVITTVAAPIHIVVGVYGMNFEAIPLLHNPDGFWFVVSISCILAFGMLLYFKNRRWI